MPKLFILVQFFGGAEDGRTILTKTPLPLSYLKGGKTYKRDHTKDHHKIRAYSLVDNTLKLR